MSLTSLWKSEENELSANAVQAGIVPEGDGEGKPRAGKKEN